MPLTKCPRCRTKLVELAAAAACPSCALDLNDARAEIQRLMKPKPGATVIPFGIMRKLPPETRRDLTLVIERARRAELGDDRRTESDRALDDTMIELATSSDAIDNDGDPRDPAKGKA